MRCGLKRMYFLAFACSTIGSVLLLIYSQRNDNSHLMVILVFLSTLGFGMGFVGTQMSGVLLFPTVLKLSAMGIIDFIS